MTRNEAIDAVKADPRNPRTWLQLGHILAREGDKGKARKSFTRALSLDPTLTEAQQALAALTAPSVPDTLPGWLRGAEQEEPSETVPALASHTQEAALTELSEHGWRILREGPEGIQVQRPREWSRAGVVLFVVLPLLGSLIFPVFFAFAVVGLLFVVADYLLRRERLEYVSRESIASGNYRRLLQGQQLTRNIIGAILILVGVIYMLNR